MKDNLKGQVILTVNTGSSSLKAGLYRCAEASRVELSAEVERIGRPDSRFHIVDSAGTVVLDEERPIHDHDEALVAMLEHLDQNDMRASLCGVGHRVVHGGAQYSEPTLVTGEVIAALRSLIPIDPNHLPQAIDAIETVRRRFPHVPQIACFDTAFHRSMPRVAQMYALPRWIEQKGVLRYGFHGLSCESIMDQLKELKAAHGRVVIAHLGNGASMTAVHESRGIDTTMGFTPAGGLVMGTRSGDLDPGVLLYLLHMQGLTATAVSTLVNEQSGMLGVSSSSADMRDLLLRESDNPRAAEAVQLFCYQAKKFLGSLVAVLGGLDTLVFTGGIGEHAAPIRQRICQGLDCLGIELDATRNGDQMPVISRDASPATVRVMTTDEDAMIAKHTTHLVRNRGEDRVSV